MKSSLVKLIVSLSLVAMVSGCLTNEAGQINKQALVGVTGAVAGGAIGSNIGKGSGNTAAIIGGAVLGGLLGSELGKSLDKADVSYMNRAQHNAFENVSTGRAAAWKNPDSGNYGTIVPTKTYETNNGYCREFTQTITVGGKTQKGYGTACRQPDGSWQLVN